MELSRHEPRSGLPRHSPGDLPDLGKEPVSPVAPVALQSDFVGSESWKAKLIISVIFLPLVKYLDPHKRIEVQLLGRLRTQVHWDQDVELAIPEGKSDAQLGGVESWWP